MAPTVAFSPGLRVRSFRGTIGAFATADPVHDMLFPVHAIGGGAGLEGKPLSRPGNTPKTMNSRCLLLLVLVLGATLNAAAQAPAATPAPAAGAPSASLTEAVRDLVRSDEGRKGEGVARWVRQQAERRLRITVRRSRS